MPHISDDNLLAEVQSLTVGAGFVSLDDRTLIELTGDDCIAFFQNLCTNDIRRLQPGQGCEAFLCDVRGKTVGHVFALLQSDSLVVSTTGGQAEKLMAHLEKYHITEDVQLTDRSKDWTELLLSGPKWQDSLPSQIDLPVQYLQHAGGQVRGVEVDIARVDITGESSYLLRCASGERERVLDGLCKHGGTACSIESLEIARIKAGFPWFGIDITDAHLPQEVNRNDRAISFTKGCYLGQETVARIDAMGHVNKLLVGLRFEGEDHVMTGMPLESGGAQVGAITSVARPLPDEGLLALGYVRREKAEPGTLLESPAGPARVIKSRAKTI